ncbi:MAG: rRNA maturation RNase YbeY [Oscillospiraceae bacterium]|nr:rRNA maturation RNase YbeY [Oscillospiraceae bacterium]
MRCRVGLKNSRNLSKEERGCIRGCVRLCLRSEAEKIGFSTRVDLFVVRDSEMREINLATRKQNKTTDVLSFPAIDFSHGDKSIADPTDGKVFLGDIIISIDRARLQAQEYGHSISRELGFLATHAALHLLGYDHQTPQEYAHMRLQEEKMLKKRGLVR